MNRDTQNDNIPGDVTTGRKKDETVLLSGYRTDQSDE